MVDLPRLAASPHLSESAFVTSMDELSLDPLFHKGLSAVGNTFRNLLLQKISYEFRSLSDHLAHCWDMRTSSAVVNPSFKVGGAYIAALEHWLHKSETGVSVQRRPEALSFEAVSTPHLCCNGVERVRKMFRRLCLRLHRWLRDGLSTFRTL